MLQEPTWLCAGKLIHSSFQPFIQVGQGSRIHESVGKSPVSNTPFLAALVHSEGQRAMVGKLRPLKLRRGLKVH